MVKTSKSKANKWFDDNYAKNLAQLAIALITVYKGKSKMDGLYSDFKTVSSRYGQYKRIEAFHKIYTHCCDKVNRFYVDFLLSDVAKRVFFTKNNTKKIQYLPVYQWLLYLLATLLYEGVTGKDFDADPDQNFKLLMQVDKNKVDKFIDVVAELFIEECSQ
jgi:hypothetical protein